MKRQRHQHKESFSILLISNSDRSSRQFDISLSMVRTLLLILLLICALAAWLIFLVSTSHSRQEALKDKLAAKDKQVEQLEAEKESTNRQIQALTIENESLRQAIDSGRSGAETGGETETDDTDASLKDDPAFPSLFPSTGSGMLADTYSDGQPYLSISTRSESNIIATADGTIMSVSSDNTYPLIIEADHGNGYQTRYMCRQEAELKTEEGASVHAGDTLLTITLDDTQLDYQVLFEGETVDPLTVIEAKG